MGPKGNEPWHDLPLARTAFNALCTFPQTQTADSVPGRTGHAGILAAFFFISY